MKICIDKLDQLFSQYIRLRDKVCKRCGNSNTILQCAHFYGRAKRSVRWDPDNACALCFGCHRYLDSNPIQKIEFFINLLGEERLLHLMARARQTYPKPDRQAIEIWLRAEIRKEDEQNR
jgi:hypothetical protein